MVSIFGKDSENNKGAKISITSIELNYMGYAHRLDGFETEQEVFEIRLPFKNKESVASSFDKDIKKPDMRVDEIRVGKPFELVGVTPSLPIVVHYKESTEIKLKIKAPKISYSGPLLISLISNDYMAHISISEIVAKKGSKSVVLDSSIHMYVPKGEIIKQDIQAYKLMEPDEKVSKITIEKPFQIVKTNPSAPFKVEKKNSYVISLYIKMPEFDYAGPMEIIFE